MENSFKKNLLLDRRFSCKDAISSRGPIWEGSQLSSQTLMWSTGVPFSTLALCFIRQMVSLMWVREIISENGLPGDNFWSVRPTTKRNSKESSMKLPFPQYLGVKGLCAWTGPALQLELSAKAQRHSEKKQAPCPLHHVHPYVSKPLLVTVPHRACDSPPEGWQSWQRLSSGSFLFNHTG